MIHVYIGCNPNGSDDRPATVLERSIVANTGANVKFHRIGDGTGSTGFSGSRFLLAQASITSEYAIYLDSDMLVFGDIEELYDYRREGKWVGCTSIRRQKVVPASCVSVVHRAEFAPPVYTNAALRQHPQYVCEIPERWNMQDKYTDDTKLLHFTAQRSQPWKDGVAKDRDIDKMWIDLA